MRFTDNGIYLTDADVGALARQQEEEQMAAARMLRRALEAEPHERERMRRELASHLLAVRAENRQLDLRHLRRPDITLTLTRKQLQALIQDELHRNNARWEEITKRVLYADKATIKRMRKEHERRQAARSVAPPVQRAGQV